MHCSTFEDTAYTHVNQTDLVLGDNADLEKRPVYTFDNGATYEGQWKGDQRHGRGLQVWPDGAKYNGEWRDDTASGEGTFHHIDGDVYKGQWKAGVAEGFGTYHHADGSSFHGEWKGDVGNGTGCASWPDGRFQCGAFVNTKIHGFGALLRADGSMFIGQWETENMHGTGRSTWTNGRKYIGQYVHDQKNGVGTLFEPDGTSYYGMWKDDKKHRVGLYTNARGEVRYGRWEDGKRIEWVQVPPSPHAIVPIDEIALHAAVVWIGMAGAGFGSLPWAMCNGSSILISSALALPFMGWAVWNEDRLLNQLGGKSYKAKVFMPTDPDPLSGKSVKDFMQARGFCGSKGILASLTMLKLYSFLDGIDVAADISFPALVRSCDGHDSLVSQMLSESFEPIPLLGGYIAQGIRLVQFFGLASSVLLFSVCVLQGAYGVCCLVFLKRKIGEGAEIDFADVAQVTDFAGMQAASKIFADMAEAEATTLAESSAEPGEWRRMSTMLKENLNAVRKEMTGTEASDAQSRSWQRLVKEAGDLEVEADEAEAEKKKAEARAQKNMVSFLANVIGRKVLAENVLQMELQSSFTAIRASISNTPLAANFSIFVSVLLSAASAASKALEAITKARNSPGRVLKCVVLSMSLSIFLIILHVFLKLAALTFCESKILSISEGGCLHTAD